jgi:hypothetical protein
MRTTSGPAADDRVTIGIGNMRGHTALIRTAALIAANQFSAYPDLPLVLVPRLCIGSGHSGDRKDCRYEYRHVFRHGASMHQERFVTAGSVSPLANQGLDLKA